MTSVRGENGLDAGKWILENAPALPVVARENAVMPAGTLGEPLSQTDGSGAIFRTTVEDGPLDVLSEGYPALYVSACAATEPLRALKAQGYFTGDKYVPVFGVDATNVDQF